MLLHLFLASTASATLCWLVDESCDLLLSGSKITSAGLCEGLDVAISEACKLFAPPEINQWCQNELLQIKSHSECIKTVEEIGAFGAKECKSIFADKVIGCPAKPSDLERGAVATAKLGNAPANEKLGVNLMQYQTCPGTTNAIMNIHTMAQMQVTFENSCAEVAAEIEARANGEDGWTDPHNDGHYSVLASSATMVSTERKTRMYKYTDKQTFALTPNGESGCIANMCSESQGTSANSGGTDMCDMFDLFCNSSEKNPENGVTCKPVKTDLKYTIDSEQCGRYVFGKVYAAHQCQNALTTCLKVQSKAHVKALEVAQELKHEPVLGQYKTCPGNHAAFNVHTMAQMQVNFKNSCADVAAELEARASNQDGWKDPHNDGHYSLVSSDATMVETQRYTHGYKYLDKQSFALQPSGTGCTMYACSESQGTSADSQGTDMCDMYSLFCNNEQHNSETGVSCKSIKYNLQYTIAQKDCGNWFGEAYVGHTCPPANPTCLRTPSSSTLESRLAPELQQPVLGQYKTCPGNHAAFNVHTMAQMQVNFQNSCADVAAELEARASNQDGWKDPHNDGHYSLVSSDATMVETQRYTHGYKYLDKQSFALQPAGTGCTMYACSESQGTSADSQGTDMCDMYSLFCNNEQHNSETGVSCKSIKYNLQYTIAQKDCGNWFGEAYVGHTCPPANPTCLRTPSSSSTSLAAPEPVLAWELSDVKQDMCFLAPLACDAIFGDGSKILSAGACTGLQAAGLEACKIFAPELAPLCKSELEIFEKACVSSTNTAGEFGAGECRKLTSDFLGCATKAELAVAETPSPTDAPKTPSPTHYTPSKADIEETMCWLADEACDVIFEHGSEIVAAKLCPDLKDAALYACKLFANKLDPLCEKELPIFEVACKASVVTAGKFGAAECKKIPDYFGCPKKPEAPTKQELCWVTDQACHVIFADGSKILSAGMCSGLNASAMEACKLFASELDPLCEKELPIFETACKESIIKAGCFGQHECRELAAKYGGCPQPKVAYE